MYLIRVLAGHDCWIADIEGDPGRTLVKANAKRFTQKPIKKLADLSKQYPRRAFSIETETEEQEK